MFRFFKKVNNSKHKPLYIMNGVLYMKRFVKVLIFFITFFVTCLNNASTTDILEDSSSEPVNSTIDYSWQSEEDEDLIALRLGNIKDIQKPRAIKYLEIDDEHMINKFKEAPGLLKNNLSQSLDKNGVVEASLDLVFSSKNAGLSFDNSIKVYKYRNKVIAVKFSQLIPFTGAELNKFDSLRKDYLQYFLEEDTEELHNTINDCIQNHLNNYPKTINSSQDYCFMYGNYGVQLSFQNSMEKRDSFLLTIYIYLNQK